MLGYDIESAAFFAAPNETLHRMRERNPVYWHAGLDAFILTRYEDVQRLLRDPRFSVSRGGDGVGQCDAELTRDKLAECNRFFAKWLVYSDPPRHTALRAVATSAFTPHTVERLRPTIERVAEGLLEPRLPSGRMDLVRDFAMPLPALMSCEMLGLPRERLADCQRWGGELFAIFRAGSVSSEMVDVTFDALQACRTYFGHLITERRSRPGDDLISRIAFAGSKEGDLEDEELIGMCVMLMAGAHELTSHAIANGAYALLRHPEQLQRLREDPHRVASAVEEILRYDGPTFRAYRRALNDVEICDVPVRAGTKVYGILHAANHDPAQFQDPDRFDIERKDNRHLGLGAGIHACLAAALVRLETQIAIDMLIRCLPDPHLFGEAPRWVPNLVTRGLRSLSLSFSPSTARSHTFT